MAASSHPPEKHIAQSFDPKDVESSCLRLVKGLSPQWESATKDDVQFKAYTEGITNTLMKVSHQWPGRSRNDADREAVLVRAYGSGTETMIDRSKELRVHRSLAARGLASSVLATFENGFMCGFIPGQACSAQDFHDREISRAMANRLGQWHGSLPVSELAADDGSGNTSIPNIWTNAQKWIELLPANTSDLQQRNDTFRRELAWLSDLLGCTPGIDGKDLVLSHTDLLCGNVILEETTDSGQDERSVTFIDYEYATAAPPAFDVANVFAEWAGPEGELSWMPSKSQRSDFIKHYVQSFRTHNDPRSHQSDAEQIVNKLYEQVDNFRGLPGFYWGIWGLIQASISDIDFDYTGYADRRLSEYWGWKAEHDGSRAKTGAEPTIREQAWARESPANNGTK